MVVVLVVFGFWGMWTPLAVLVTLSSWSACIYVEDFSAWNAYR